MHYFDEELKDHLKKCQHTGSYVYVLKCGARYKIGRTGNLDARIPEVGRGVPDAWSVIHVMRFDSYWNGLERFWHGVFSHLKRKGEWYQLGNPELVWLQKTHSVCHCRNSSDRKKLCLQYYAYLWRFYPKIFDLDEEALSWLSDSDVLYCDWVSKRIWG